MRKSVADPAFDARINVVGTINVLEAAQRAGVRRVVNTSTGGAIYGEGQIIPAPEDHPVAPEAPYGQSKFCAEGYCELFRRLHGLSTVSLRYGNVYGPRQDPLGEAGVIAIFCGKLLDGGAADDLRRRPADARLRLRGRRGGGQPARRRSRTRPAPFNVGRGVPDDGARPRRGAAPSIAERRLRGRARARARPARCAHRARLLARAGGARLGAAGRPRRGPRADARLAALRRDRVVSLSRALGMLRLISRPTRSLTR